MDSQRLFSIVVLASAALAALIYTAAGFAEAAAFTALGLAYGYLLYRGKLCFATAMYGFNLPLTRAILLSLLAAGAGAYALEAAGLVVPALPPAGFHIVVGSVIFGVGMVFAGGCITGTMFRLGGGSLQHAFAFLGILAGGLAGVFLTWPLAEVSMAAGFRPYLALGPHLSFLFNAAVIVALVLYLYKREGTRPFSDLKSAVYIAAILFAVVWVVQFAFFGALVTQVPLARAMLYATGLAPPETWLSFVGGLRPPYADPLLLLVVAMLAGSAAASLWAREFLGFRRVDARTAAVAFMGGVVMGLGVWLAVGCNISGFYSAVSSLRVDGWLYGLGLFIGAQLGLRIRQRLGI